MEGVHPSSEHTMRTVPTTVSSVQSVVSFLLATVVLVGGAIGALPSGPALFVGAALGLLGGVALGREVREATRRREAADGVIETLPPQRVPGGLRWRADELTSPRERRRLARGLRSVLKLIDRPGAIAVTPVPLNWRAIRRERQTVEEVASLLADTRRPVSPRGVLLARRLVLDYVESPLYVRRNANELHQVLARLRAELPDDRG